MLWQQALELPTINRQPGTGARWPRQERSAMNNRCGMTTRNCCAPARAVPSATPAASPEPGPAGCGAGLSVAEVGTPGLVLLYTTLATWQLLTCPAAVNLSLQPVPAADRAAGLRTGPVTVAAAARIP